MTRSTNRNKDLVTFDSFTLERVKIACRSFLDGEALRNLRIDTHADEITNRMVVDLRTYVMGEKVHETSKSVYFRYPANWWEYLKWQHFPSWYVLRWPVKFTTSKKTVKFEQIQCFPMFRQVFPRDDQKFEFSSFQFSEFARDPFSA